MLVQDPKHGVFAEQAGHHRDAEVDLAPADVDGKAAILGDALFTNVELCHHLHAGDHLFGQAHIGQLPRSTEHAVDAVLDDQAHRRVLKMNVTRAALVGVVQGRVHQPNDLALVASDGAQGDLFALAAGIT
ncbi:hypothetical protein D9M72_407840 [compost metagenome]